VFFYHCYLLKSIASLKIEQQQHEEEEAYSSQQLPILNPQPQQ
jgi:hypothetical protein